MAYDSNRNGSQTTWTEIKASDDASEPIAELLLVGYIRLVYTMPLSQKTLVRVKEGGK